MTPKQIVAELDKHIVGQLRAKQAVAIALRNRWRRQQVAEPLRHEITPKNILMIGPTGVGKTEIARRLARLAQAPFIKVEATKFTEVGYVGKDVDTIIRDLTEIGLKQVRQEAMQQVVAQAEDAAEARILDRLVPVSRSHSCPSYVEASQAGAEVESSTRQIMRQRLREGTLDDKEIEIEIALPNPEVTVAGPAGMEELTHQLQGLFQGMGGRKKTRKLRIAEARKLLKEEEASKLVNDDDIKTLAISRVEQHGIVFLDEVDKIAARSEGSGAEVSRQGVQRDLLPLVEGTTVSTRHGLVRTEHILFIASGAFHVSKPSDLIPELQGRFPIRVELDALSVTDFQRILTETDASLIKQYQALLTTEGVTLEFLPQAIERLAQIAWSVNERTENIGARRLHTVLEKLLEEVSLTASERVGECVRMDAASVDARLAELAADEDLARYVL